MGTQQFWLHLEKFYKDITSKWYKLQKFYIILIGFLTGIIIVEFEHSEKGEQLICRITFNNQSEKLYYAYMIKEMTNV